MVIEELKTLVTKRDVNQFVPDIDITVASLLDNPSDECSILALILKNLWDHGPNFALHHLSFDCRSDQSCNGLH